MNATPALIQHDLDSKTIEEIHELRILRLRLTEQQLANLKDTASRITKQEAFADSEGSEILMMQIKVQLVKKITMLKERISQPEVLFPDELAFYLDIAEQKPSS